VKIWYREIRKKYETSDDFFLYDLKLNLLNSTFNGVLNDGKQSIETKRKYVYFILKLIVLNEMLNFKMNGKYPMICPHCKNEINTTNNCIVEIYDDELLTTAYHWILKINDEYRTSLILNKVDVISYLFELCFENNKRMVEFSKYELNTSFIEYFKVHSKMRNVCTTCGTIFSNNSDFSIPDKFSIIMPFEERYAKESTIVDFNPLRTLNDLNLFDCQCYETKKTKTL